MEQHDEWPPPAPFVHSIQLQLCGSRGLPALSRDDDPACELRALSGPGASAVTSVVACKPEHLDGRERSEVHVLRHYATVLRTTLLVVARRKRTDRCLIPYNTSSFTTLLFARLDNWFIMQ